MTTWFVSRHAGAVEWARRQQLAVDCFVPHLNASLVASGDTVIGTLPVNLAAEVCRRGARYLHLNLPLTATLRGTELTADDLDRLGARLELYEVR